MRTLALIVPLLLAVPVSAQDVTPAEDIATAYGIEGWDQIETIKFTFNVQLPGKDAVVSRSWSWDVANEKVTLKKDLEAVFFALGEVTEASEEFTRKAHGQFINDSYWLLFPFQLVWSDPAVTAAGSQPLPMGDGTAEKVIAQWPSEGGYTPGDAYDLYLGDDGLIKQWVFRRGGKDKASPATWEDHRQLGPILVSLDHYGPEAKDGKQRFRLWFTEVQVTLTDGTVVTPEAMDQP